MKKVERLSKLKACGIVAVVRGTTRQEALEASRAIVRGGIKGIELTFTVPQAAEVIAELVNDYQEDQEVMDRSWHGT